MRAGMVRNAAVLCAVAALVGGCGGGGGDATSAVLAGRWTGALTIGFAGAGGLSGGIVLELDQSEDFVAGSAQWAAIGETQGVGGPVDGNDFELHMQFRCFERTDAGDLQRRTETAILEGRADGETMTITGVTGKACEPQGIGALVDSASGTLTRERDTLPL